MSQPETDAAHRLLRSWASLLRFSTDAAGERRPEVVTIDLTPSEAVLLDTILRRHSESDRLTVANPAERQCLYNVECLLEKHGDRPLWPSLADAIHELAPEGI